MKTSIINKRIILNLTPLEAERVLIALDYVTEQQVAMGPCGGHENCEQMAHKKMIKDLHETLADIKSL